MYLPHRVAAMQGHNALRAATWSCLITCCTRAQDISKPNLTCESALQQEAITEQRFPDYARDMVACAYPDSDVPEWITLGLELADITL